MWKGEIGGEWVGSGVVDLGDELEGNEGHRWQNRNRIVVWEKGVFEECWMETEIMVLLKGREETRDIQGKEKGMLGTYRVQ